MRNRTGMQRLRLKYGCGQAAKYVSHLDTVRAWERAFRRAGIPLDYTKGFTPRPKLAVASPLPVGFTGSGELMDIWVRKWMPPAAAYMMITEQLPEGFLLDRVDEVPVTLPSLQSRVCAAQYRCAAFHACGLEEARRAARDLLDRDSYVYEYQRGEETRSVDVRTFVLALEIQKGESEVCVIDLHVKHGAEGTIRPDHVLSALGFCQPPESVHRSELSIRP